MAQHALLVAGSIARHLGTVSVKPSAVKSSAMAGRIAIGCGVRSGRVDRAQRPKLCKLACRPFLRRTVSTLLQRQWSPEQIAGWLKRTISPMTGHAADSLKSRCHTRRSIAACSFRRAGVLKKELLEHLRARRTVRRSRHASMKRNGLGQIKMPYPSASDRRRLKIVRVPGHWGGRSDRWIGE